MMWSLSLLVLVAVCHAAEQQIEVNDNIFRQFGAGRSGGRRTFGRRTSGTEFRKVVEARLENGVKKARFEQFVNGVRVANTAVVTTVTDAGKQTDATGVMYRLERRRNLVRAKVIGATRATEKAKEAFRMKNGSAKAKERNVKARLLVDPTHGKVYEVNFLASGASKPSRPFLLIDASNGTVVDEWEGLDIGYVDGSGPGGNTKTGKYMYGKGGKYKAFKIGKKGTLCTLENDAVKAINMNHGDDDSDDVVEDAFSYNCGADNTNSVKEINGAYSPMNDAFYFGKVLYDMYKDWVNLTPLTFKLVIRLHYKCNYDNAFWDGQTMTFGDGSGGASCGDGDGGSGEEDGEDGDVEGEVGGESFPLVDINVVTHEAAHGFTEQNSNLVYKEMSGGMNEAYSDIAGESAEQYMRGTVDWMVGADITRGAGKAMRYFKNPESDGFSIGHASKYMKEMDVHESSGVFNKAFYLIVNSEGWNVKKAFQVFTFANKLYWTSQSTFDQGACGVLKSTRDHGYPQQAVIDAFKTVGVNTCKLQDDNNKRKPATTSMPHTQGPATCTDGDCPWVCDKNTCEDDMDCCQPDDPLLVATCNEGFCRWKGKRSVEWSDALANTWSSKQCANLGSSDETDVTKCQQSCEAHALCTAVNFKETTGNCVLRQCARPVPPPETYNEGYAGYHVKDASTTASTTPTEETTAVTDDTTSTVSTTPASSDCGMIGEGACADATFITATDESSLEDCRQKCQEHQYCEYFEYLYYIDPENYSCNLMSTCTELQASEELPFALYHRDECIEE